jgi:hypothetical protein
LHHDSFAFLCSRLIKVSNYLIALTTQGPCPNPLTKNVKEFLRDESRKAKRIAKCAI